MQETASLTNPLDLDIEWRSGIEPIHEVRDEDKLAALTASMQNNGWQGAPIVCSADRAYSGSHRIRAWQAARDDVGASMPCIDITNLVQACGIDYAELLDAFNGDEEQAITRLAYDLPADVTDTYGLDLH